MQGYIEAFLVERIRRIVFVLLVVVAVALWVAWAFGCAGPVHHVATTQQIINPVAHPIQSVGTSTASVLRTYVILHILGFIGTGISAGLFVAGLLTGNTPLERPALIAGSVCGMVASLSLAGIILLPFAVWVVVAFAVLAVAFLGYEVYAKLKKAE